MAMATQFHQKYIVTPRYLTTPSKRRSGRLVSPDVKFVVAHDTGNPGSTADANAGYFERSRDDESASAHIFVDDKALLECIPALTGAPEKAWHVLYQADTDNRLYGHDANDAAIGVEYCFGDNIDADEAYRKYVWVIAYLCFHFGLDPETSVVGHFFLDPKRKTDPVTGLARSRRTYDQLLLDIATEHAACLVADEPPESTTTQAGTFVQATGSVVTTAKLNIRKGAPSRLCEIVQEIPTGTALTFDGWVTDGEPVNGNPKWFRDANGNYFWSGATA